MASLHWEDAPRVRFYLALAWMGACVIGVGWAVWEWVRA